MRKKIPDDCNQWDFEFFQNVKNPILQLKSLGLGLYEGIVSGIKFDCFDGHGIDSGD